MISIVVCNYNYGKYIAEAIESVLAQTYHNFELIIVDDGSTDCSRKIIETYAKRYPREIIAILKENEGQASAMCAGVLASNGDIVCFLDSDDIYFDDKLAIIVKHINHYDPDGIVHNARVFGDMFAHGGREIWPALTPPSKPVWIDNNTSIDDYDLFYTIASCLTLKKDLAKKIARFKGKYWPHKHYGDVYFDRPVYLLGKILYIPEILTGYRVHGLSHHIDNITVRGNKNSELRKEFLMEKYSYVNKILRYYGHNEINLNNNLMWLELKFINKAIGYKTYLRCFWKTSPQWKSKLFSMLKITTLALRNVLGRF